MSGQDWFAGDVAERYDAHLGERGDPAVIAETVDFLAALAGDGAALELAIGTGRIALPLAQRGVPVHGIDLSQDMVAQLRAKPGGAELPVTIGDFATTRVEGTFALVYLVFNTISNLTTQDAQVACFANAAAHLEPGGCFVVEVGIPDGRPVGVFDLSDTHVGVDEYDPATQRSASHHFSLIDGEWVRRSIPFRSTFPAELDLMARLAGMRLRERFDELRRRAVHEREQPARLGLGEALRPLPPRAVYFGLQFGAHLPTWVVMSVYLVRELHFSPLQLVLMGTAMEAAVFLCEVPTGVVADTYSRRLSLIIGYLGMGVAWAAVGLVSAPWLIIALWALWGLSYTFTSGAEQAWITDEVGFENVGTVFLRGARYGQVGAVLGLLAQVGRRRALAPRRGDPRRRLHDRVRARLPRVHARARLPPACRARSAARRSPRCAPPRPRACATRGRRRRSCS